MNNNKKNKLKKTLKSILWIIVGAVISLTVTGLVRTGWGSFQTPESYKIIIVGEESDESITKFKKNLEKYWDEENPVFGKEKRPIEIEGMNNDFDANNQYEINEFINETVLNDEGVIMVIGHFYSDITMKTLPYYLKRSSPVPILCPMETNTQLVEVIEKYENDKDTLSSPVFCFAPDDKKQAQKAAEFAISSLRNNHLTNGDKINKFWVVRDVENPKYSKDLANTFIDNIQDDSSGQVILLSQVDNLPPVSTVLEFDFDCIFFAGFYENGRLLLNYINYIYGNQVITENKRKKPLIILSDGCEDLNLFNNGTNDEFLDIYLTSSYINVDSLSKRVFSFISTMLLEERINDNTKGSDYYDCPFYVVNETSYAREAIQIALREIKINYSKSYRDKNSKFYIKKVDILPNGELGFTQTDN